MLTFIGAVMIVAGAIVVVNTLLPLNGLLVEAFKFQGVYTLEEVTTASAMPYLDAEIGGIFGLGFLIHIILARIMPRVYDNAFKHIYWASHVMWTMAGMLALVLNNYGFTGVTAILIGSIMLEIHLTISCAMVWPFIKRITGGDFGFGHT